MANLKIIMEIVPSNWLLEFKSTDYKIWSREFNYQKIRQQLRNYEKLLFIAQNVNLNNSCT